MSDAGGRAEREGVQLIAVAPGDGSFVIDDVLPDLWLASVKLGGAEVVNDVLDLRSGGAGPLHVSLRVGTGALSGVLSNEGVNPAPGRPVLLVPEPYQPLRLETVRVAMTNASGRFEFRDIAPGAYRVYGWSTEEGARQDAEELKRYERESKPVVIKAGRREEVRLREIRLATTPH